MDGIVQMLPHEPFSENAISFLNALSGILRNDLKTKEFPEIMTFAFFCRKANLLQLKENYYPKSGVRLGRGLVFHITPSNVPVNFAYSLVSGILSGNSNIIRLPSERSEQADMIINAFHTLSKNPEFYTFSQRTMFIRYEKQSSDSAYFSSICDARISWGGDSAIENIKKNAISEAAVDITFGDKYSLCIINADIYISEKSPQKIAEGFYNDTFLFDQNACTSPHLVIWLGSNENIGRSKKLFWDHVYKLTKTKYQLQAHSAIAKLATFYDQAIHLEGIKKTTMPDNLICRTELSFLSPDIVDHRGNCGYFLEYNATELSELSKVISEKYQTLAYYGLQKEDLIEFTKEKGSKGIDRVVPIGRTSEFSLTWDGYNLIDSMSRPI